MAGRAGQGKGGIRKRRTGQGRAESELRGLLAGLFAAKTVIPMRIHGKSLTVIECTALADQPFRRSPRSHLTSSSSSSGSAL